MPLDDEELRRVVISNLTPEERERGVAYAASEVVPAGTVFEFPLLTLHVPWDAVLAFVDREPLANWGHASRYVLLRRGGDQSTSVEAQFPPFRSPVPLNWRVVHQAPGVPDTALGVAKS